MKRVVVTLLVAVLFFFVWTLQVVSAAGPGPRVTVVSVFACPTATPKPPPQVPKMPTLRATYCKVVQPSYVEGGWSSLHSEAPVGMILSVRVDDDQWLPVVSSGDQTMYVVNDLNLTPRANCELGQIFLQITGVDKAEALSNFEAWREKLEQETLKVNFGDVVSVTKSSGHTYKIVKDNATGYVDIWSPFEFEKEKSAEAESALAGGSVPAYCPPSPDDWITSTRKTGMGGMCVLFLVIFVGGGGLVAVGILTGGLGVSGDMCGGSNIGAIGLLALIPIAILVMLVCCFLCAS